MVDITLIDGKNLLITKTVLHQDNFTGPRFSVKQIEGATSLITFLNFSRGKFGNTFTIRGGGYPNRKERQTQVQKQNKGHSD